MRVQAFEEDEQASRKALQAFRKSLNRPPISTTGQGQSVMPEESKQLILAQLQDPDWEDISATVENNAGREGKAIVECLVDWAINRI